MATIVNELRNIFLLCFRYLAVMFILSVVLMTLVTGKFPPPMKEMYTNFRTLQSAINLSDLTKGFVQMQNQRKAMLEAVENQATIDGLNLHEASLKTLEKIKALEYEVTYLKSKLATAEWQNQQLKQQLDQLTAASAASPSVGK